MIPQVKKKKQKKLTLKLDCPQLGCFLLLGEVFDSAEYYRVPSLWNFLS